FQRFSRAATRPPLARPWRGLAHAWPGQGRRVSLALRAVTARMRAVKVAVRDRVAGCLKVIHAALKRIAGRDGRDAATDRRIAHALRGALHRTRVGWRRRHEVPAKVDIELTEVGARRTARSTAERPRLRAFVGGVVRGRDGVLVPTAERIALIAGGTRIE